MGNTDTVVFTYYRKCHEEALKTVNRLCCAIQSILLPTSFDEPGFGSTLQPTFGLEAIQKQESDYLDGFLNLDHCSKLDLSKKAKKRMMAW